MSDEKLNIHAVILAGGRGTRFWPRSRTRAPKQLLNIVGKDTMLEQTVERLLHLIPPQHIWTVTNAEQAAAVKKQLPAAARKHVLTEPLGRNTAAAIGLAAIHIRHAAKSDALMAVLPSDQFIADTEKYHRIVRAALEVAREPGCMVVLGIPPTRPETGFGYVERMGEALHSLGFPVYAVRRFTEKPKLETAQEYIASGDYQWNAGMFFWRVSTFLENLKRFLPKTHESLGSLAETIGKKTYERRLRAIYSKLENISVDFAILEPSTRPNETDAGADAAGGRDGPSSKVFVIPAEIGWSDIGSWAAVYELLTKQTGDNYLAGSGLTLDASGNFLYSPSKFVAAIGIRDLVVVDTSDALLIVPRDRAQDVARLVKSLEERKLTKLL
ncbi:MAG TPA: mannose-1-phosphate guanylyltransferase [Candidatus Solibacter sp.]|nr:mannose-1-phosphate guanylyltransferase [Candidatus Solibacter sp.]